MERKYSVQKDEMKHITHLRVLVVSLQRCLLKNNFFFFLEEKRPKFYLYQISPFTYYFTPCDFPLICLDVSFQPTELTLIHCCVFIHHVSVLEIVNLILCP